MPRRISQLYAGLVLYGFSAGLLIVSGLGNDPWDVLHQGLSRHTGIGTGVWADIAGAIVLIAWIPLRQRPGFGTISNVAIVGLAIQATIEVLGRAHDPALRVALVPAGTVLNAVATGFYISADLGPGPRDGLMTGIAARGHSIRLVRSAIELAVLASGIALGGTFGPATIFYAVTIGPLVHIALPWFRDLSAPASARPERIYAIPGTPSGSVASAGCSAAASNSGSSSVPERYAS